MNFEWWPLGGLGEVGMNTMAFRFGETVVPVDAGILFADPNDFGIEALHPDYTELLKTHRIKHWIITHAHEDHIGAVPAIFRCCEKLEVDPPKILAPRFAAALIRDRLKDDSRFADVRHCLEHVEALDCDASVPMGDLTVHFVPTRHSTPDSCSIAFVWEPINKPAMRVFHTADFKLDENDFEDGRWDLRSRDVFKGERPDVLFIDSTNSERPGHSVSESEILAGLENVIRAATGRLYITLFSSNLYRIGAIAKIAARFNRSVCLAGRSIQKAARIASESGMVGEVIPDFPQENLVDSATLARMEPHRQLIVCSGSQGEFRSVLTKLGAQEHPDFVLDRGDTVLFSSKVIPGNERVISRLVNRLLATGAKVLWGEGAKLEAQGPIHASGHARSGEIRAVIEHLRPKSIVPVHGELRQLMACAEIARTTGAEYGLAPQRVHIAENSVHLSFDYVEADSAWSLVGRDGPRGQARMLRFDQFSSPSKDPFLRVRKRAALGGVVSATLDSMGRVQVQIAGMLPEEIMKTDRTREQMTEQVENWLFTRSRSLGGVSFGAKKQSTEEEISEELGRYLRKIYGVRPFVLVHLVGL